LRRTGGRADQESIPRRAALVYLERVMSRLPWPPIEPRAARVELPDPALAEGEVVAVSRSLSPGLVLQAYRKGIFPWPVRDQLVPWVSPDPRCHFPLHKAGKWPRTVRRDLKSGFTASVDRAFDDVIEACATERSEGTWITDDLRKVYLELHKLGWAHSVEVWNAKGKLAGGLYGVAVSGLFAGESMFHRDTGASKVAFAVTADRLAERGFSLFDVQVRTDHLASLGCEEVGRARYLELLKPALSVSASFGD
jgi:leucyl/phenylalanyl-tRNA--protein transferase